MTLQPLLLNFPIYEENFIFLFISVQFYLLSPLYSLLCFLPAILNYNLQLCPAFNSALLFKSAITFIFSLFLLYIVGIEEGIISLAVYFFNWLTRKLSPQVVQSSTLAFCSCSQHLSFYPPVELAPKLRRLLGKENILCRIQSKNLRILMR